MSAKDPYNTIERLTNAIEVLVTHLGNAAERVELAIGYINKLVDRDFPENDAKKMFSEIVSYSNAAHLRTMSNKEIATVMKTIWSLYWKMTSNQLYR